MAGIGERIKALLEERGMSQRELATAIGKTEVAVSRYINSIREPKASVIADIAAALNLSTDSLLATKNSTKQNVGKSCETCAHFRDTEAICILRKCRRAIPKTIDAWEPNPQIKKGVRA